MKQAFKNAVSYFQQATVDVYPVKLFTKEIDPQIIQRVAACWKLEGLEMEDYHFDASVLNIDVVQVLLVVLVIFITHRMFPN